MHDKSILITGCSTGIGLCCARGMKARGWRVLATARQADDLASLKSEGFEVIDLELMDPQSVADCADQALSLTNGQLFGVFNNAAYGQPGAIEDLPVQALRDQFEVNLFSWHDLTRRLIPAMRANGEGRIVQCSSVLGLISPPFRGAYNASKFALEALSDAMRYELAGSGIMVSLIEPGPIASAFGKRSLASLQSEIDMEGSVHRAVYRARVALAKSGGKTRFKLGPEAVLAKLIHALESPRPKVRYYVTLPTYWAAASKRVLPSRIHDRLVSRT